MTIKPGYNEASEPAVAGSTSFDDSRSERCAVVLTEQRTTAGHRLRNEVHTRISPRIARFPADRQAHAREIADWQLDILQAQFEGGPDAGWTGRTVATVRMLGHDWASRRWPLEPLLVLLGVVTDETTDVLLHRVAGLGGGMAESLRVVADVAHRFVGELFHGFQEVHKPREYSDPHATALLLLRGAELPPHLAAGAAPAYGVLAFRLSADDTADLPAHAAAWLAEQAGDGVLHLTCDQGGYALVPTGEHTAVLAFARRLQARLPPATWLGIAWRPRAELAAGRLEAVEVLTSALASRRAPGVYQLGDVLVECAVLRQPAVSELLSKLIEPIAHNQVLLETLQALLTAGGNRSKAATRLVIHRSTLDYRLGQIERLTGHAPSSARALQVLGAALTAHTAARCTLTEFPSWNL